MSHLGPIVGLLAVVMLGASTDARPAGDPAAAERQYRIARRLAAEGSAQAASALRQVIELDPGGPLADDALLDLADLQGVPRWPEDLGRITAEAARRATDLLRELVKKHPNGDRLAEAQVREALLRLEPLASRDVEGARIDLLTLATRLGAERWGIRARYCLVWLDEIEGQAQRAANAYQRLVIDAQHDPSAARAAVGVGRLAMRSGRFGVSSVWLQRAVERGAPRSTRVAELRELAVRGLLRERHGTLAWMPEAAERTALATRTVSGFDRLPGGGWLVVDRKTGVVQRLDSGGGVVTEWHLRDVQAVTVDPFGRLFAAAGTKIYRLVSGEAHAVGDQGSMAPVASIAVDAGGGVWMLDRKGGRVARLDPAGTEPEVVWEDRQLRLSDIVWDGRRLVGVDTRGAGLLAIGPAGRAERYSQVAFSKPVALAVDGAGQVAVLDGRALEVVLVGPDGGERARMPVASAGITKPTAVALGTDGSLDVIDASTSTIVRIP